MHVIVDGIIHSASMGWGSEGLHRNQDLGCKDCDSTPQYPEIVLACTSCHNYLVKASFSSQGGTNSLACFYGPGDET